MEDFDYKEALKDPYFRMIDRLPICFDWVEYKGETVFMSSNYEKTKKSGKPMIDIAYCATRACNGTFMYTVQWDKNKFKQSHLGQKF